MSFGLFLFISEDSIDGTGGGGGGCSGRCGGGRGPAVIGTHGTGTRMYTAFFCIPLPSVDATKEGGGALSVG